MWELLSNGYRFSVMQDEKSSGDQLHNCVYTLLNCIVKSGSDAKFYGMCILSH